MFRASMFALVGGMVLLVGGISGQDAKDESKKDESKVKGFLPANWGRIGLTDEQRQQVYKIQSKYGAEIDKLDARIKELKVTRDQEMKTVLTPEQKKRLEDILTGKAK